MEMELQQGQAQLEPSDLAHQSTHDHLVLPASRGHVHSPGRRDSRDVRDVPRQGHSPLRVLLGNPGSALRTIKHRQSPPRKAQPGSGGDGSSRSRPGSPGSPEFAARDNRRSDVRPLPGSDKVAQHGLARHRSAVPAARKPKAERRAFGVPSSSVVVAGMPQLTKENLYDLT
jgi:hypothetical protein